VPAQAAGLRVFLRTQLGRVVWEFGVMLGVLAYFLLFGLTPITGGDRLGLVGADEPPNPPNARQKQAQHNTL